MIDKFIEALVEAQVETQNETERLIQTQIIRGESQLFFYHAKIRAPFLVRICPFLPDLFFRDRKFIIVGTNRRVLVLELKNPIVRKSNIEIRRLEASIPYTQIQNIIPSTGRLSSSIEFLLKNKRSLKYQLLASQANEIAIQINVASKISDPDISDVQEFRSLIIGKTNPISKIFRCLSTLLGVLLVTGGIIALAENKDKSQDEFLGFVILALPFLWFGILNGLFKRIRSRFKNQRIDESAGNKS